MKEFARYVATHCQASQRVRIFGGDEIEDPGGRLGMPCFDGTDHGPTETAASYEELGVDSDAFSIPLE